MKTSNLTAASLLVITILISPLISILITTETSETKDEALRNLFIFARNEVTNSVQTSSQYEIPSPLVSWNAFVLDTDPNKVILFNEDIEDPLQDKVLGSWILISNLQGNTQHCAHDLRTIPFH